MQVTNPQRGWPRLRGRRRISWLHQVCTDLNLPLLTLWTLPLIGTHGEQSQRLPGYTLHNDDDDDDDDDDLI